MVRKPVEAELIRTSFGQPVYQRGVFVFSLCPLCGEEVEMNGPGSDESWYGRLWLTVSRSLWPLMVFLTTPASDVHDLRYHQGFLSNEGREDADKEHRLHNYSQLGAYFTPRMKELSIQIRYLAPTQGVPRWWKSLINSDHRHYYTLCKNLKDLREDRKVMESWIEAQYEALRMFGKSNCRKDLCTNPRT